MSYLHVPVNDVVRVEVVESVDELLGDFADLFLRQGLVVFEDLEKLALSKLKGEKHGRYFGDDAEVVGCFEGVDHEDDVLVDQTA